MANFTPDDGNSQLRSGSLVKISYEGREFEVIVIDPNGLGPGQPSVGFGYRMAERNAGVPESTIRSWVREKPDGDALELPSGKAFEVREISATDGNTYKVIEASDWLAIAIDLLVNPGRTGKGLRTKLGDFLTWFAVKGFYAEAYVALRGVYTAVNPLLAFHMTSACRKNPWGPVFWAIRASTVSPVMDNVG